MMNSTVNLVDDIRSLCLLIAESDLDRLTIEETLQKKD